MSAVDQAAAQEPVKLADIRAPHLSAWECMAAATTPVVAADKPDPFDVGRTIPWCTACQEHLGGKREHAHTVGARRPLHLSQDVHVLLSMCGPASEVDDGFRLPSLAVGLDAVVTVDTPRPLVRLLLTQHGETELVTRLTLTEVNNLIRTLTAVVELATGRDDFTEEP